MLHDQEGVGNDTVVYAFCAAWCGTCTAYAATWARLVTALPEVSRWVWVDVEDHADAMGDVDIDHFPSLGVWSGGAWRFFGTVLPHEGTALRVIRAALAPSAPAVPPPPGATADWAPRLAAIRS